MTKEKNVVRTFTIKYTIVGRRKIYEFTTDKPMVAQRQYEYFTSPAAKSIFGLEIVSSSFDGEVNA
jgi:hypothetical protein